MPVPQKGTIRFWQWPNILALDAALIAILWQAALAHAMGLRLSASAHIVLGLSVWLSYTADRLFDVARRDASTLLSVRHRFAKRQCNVLWRVWMVVLMTTPIVDTQLSGTQLRHGGVLLVLCLLYTLLNQKFSRCFFPKELCVALIYAGGVAILLPDALSFKFLGSFACLCLLNCLVIGKKEYSVDAHLRTHSLAGRFADSHLTPLIGLGAILTALVDAPLQGSLVLSFVLLGIVNAWRARLSTEVFRVLADSALLIGPVFGWLLHSF